MSDKKDKPKLKLVSSNKVKKSSKPELTAKQLGFCKDIVGIGKDKDGNAIEDHNGLAPVAQHIDRASRYTMNPYVYQYMANLAKDARDYEANPHSYWDESANVLPYYR